MTFTNNIRDLEKIKSENKGYCARQEIMMHDPIANMSKVAVDSDIVNESFASLVSYYLSKSDFKMFSTILLNNEVQFISDAIGYGDILSFYYDEKKQINTIKYQNSDKLINVILKTHNDKAYVIRVVDTNDKVIETMKTFKENNGEYYQISSSKKLIKKEDELTTYAIEEYKYDLERDSLEKDFTVITKEFGKTISKSSIKQQIDKSDYVVEDGKFYTIIKKSELNRMKKCKKLENKLVDSF